MTAVNQISFIDSMLEDSTIYTYFITAKNEIAESAPSDTIALSTLSAGVPPQIPSAPSPSDNSFLVPINTSLLWVCSDPDGDSLRYDIYFGTGAYLELVDSNRTENYFNVPSLLYDTPYVWKIAARDCHHHVTQSPIWHFRTRPNASPNAPNQPIPADDSQGVSINGFLNWRCEDPDGDSLTYDIYFGANSNPPLVAISQTETRFNPGPLQYLTSYHWRIAAKDTFGNETRGLIWSFVTQDSIYFLTVLLQGMGRVVLSPDRRGYAYGDSVLLTAIPDSNWTFNHWSGDISEIINPLTIVITRNMSITANFTEGHQNSTTISGTITWPGHALSSHTYFFADSLVGMNLFTVGQTTVNPITGNYTLILGTMPGPIPLLFEGQDDVNNSGAHDPIDAGDGWGYFDYNGNGQWGASDTMIVAPGDHVTGVNIELHLISADKISPRIPSLH